MVDRGDVRRAPSGLRLTYDDLVLFPDDGQRHEIVDGEHYVTPSPNLRHQRALGDLYWLIRSYLEAHPVGEVLFAPLDVVLSPYDVVEPDLLFVSRERAAGLLTKLNVQGPPDLVIEITSPGTRRPEETIKRRLYERSQVVEYWVVDPELDVVRVYRREGDAFARVVEVSRERGDVPTTLLLPGLELRLTDILKE